MEWITKFHGQTVGLDTSPLVFFIEENPLYDDLLDPFFNDLDAGRFRVVTSTITLLEVLVHPLRYGNEGLAQQYNDILLSSPNVTMLPVTTQWLSSLQNYEPSINSKRRMPFSLQPP